MYLKKQLSLKRKKVKPFKIKAEKEKKRNISPIL